MADIKKELMTLLMQKGFGVEGATIAADHLIANGLTIQQWISVEERLPEPFVSVLGHCPECDPLFPVHECYMLNDAGVWCNAQGCAIEGLTHWMPLPEPPKGE